MVPRAEKWRSVTLPAELRINLNDNELTWLHYLCEILNGVSFSAIASAAISFAVDIPSRTEMYKKSFLNALTSNRYLSQLERPQLQQLRLDVTKALYSTVSVMPKEILLLDDFVCKYLEKVYCSRYRQTVVAEDDNDTDYVKKKNMIEYDLFNPCDKPVELPIRFHNLIMMKNSSDKIEDYIPDFKLELLQKESDDNGNTYNSVYQPYDIGSEYCLGTGAKPDPNDEFYNTSIILTSNGNDGITVSISKYLKVKISYTIRVPKKDPCFTKRVAYPTTNFRIDYTHNSKNNDVHLFGQLFGTEIAQSEIDIRYIKNNQISIETQKWLLPKDGAIVVSSYEKK